MSVPGFWDHPETAQAVVGELKSAKATIEPVQAALAKVEDIEVLLELADESGDAEARMEVDRELKTLRGLVGRVELMTLLSGPNDDKDCYFSIQSGAGGTDACDWAEMMLRMYLRYFERHGYAVEELSRKDGEEAGIQSVSLLVRGPYACGYLSCEMGVHRMERISPFNAQGKRQTSFASVDVMPEMDEIAITVDWDKEVREDTYRASGAGGQHVNKTSSAIRLTHLPTNLVVQCQNERSQHKNRAAARKMLATRLQQLEQAKRDAELSKVYSDKGQIAWGNRIRTYTLQPYQQVKDERNGHKTADVPGVLDGDLQPFIEAQLRKRASGGRK
jgi:peptide chain release factor 2